MQIGKLTFKPIKDGLDLVAEPVKQAVENSEIAESIFVTAIDPKVSDTGAFCEQYGVGLDISTNCLVVQARRADKTWYAACLILATDMADINNVIRRHLNARKISFASMDIALELTHMEYGGITPIGLPSDWIILVDEAVMRNDVVVVGGGVRGSKLALKTEVFKHLPNAVIMKITQD